MKNLVMLAKGGLPEWSIILILLAFFGVIVLAVILIKKKVAPLQIKKPEMSEEEAIQEELNRVLVPVDDETQKQMEEAMKKDEE